MSYDAELKQRDGIGDAIISEMSANHCGDFDVARKIVDRFV